MAWDNVMHRPVIAAVATLIALILALPAQLSAETAEEFLAALAADGFNEKIAAVERIAAAGEDRLVPALDALLAGDLYLRKEGGLPVIGKAQGSTVVLRNALSGAEIGQTPAADLDKVRINNRLRGVARGAIGGLTLFSADPAKRRAAAKAVFTAPQEGLYEVLGRAIERETDAGIRSLLDMALAADRLAMTTDSPTRTDAVALLAKYPTPDVRNLLGSLAQGDADPDVRAAAANALVEVEKSLALWSSVGAIFQGVSLGSVLLLAAVGLAITFGVMGVINMAHGELVMIGAYTTFVVQEVFRTHFPGAFDHSLTVALPLAFLVSGSFGIAIERGIIRHLYGRPLETLLATWGLSLILQQMVRTVFGPTNREVGAPSWMSGAFETAGGLVLTYNRIVIVIFSLSVVAAIAIVMRKTSFGLRMRAVTQNRQMAASMGIRTGRIDALTFGLGSGIAGVAGVALSQIDNVSPNLGQSYIIDSFLVVVFGGVGNLWGTLLGALSLGIVNKFLEPYAGAVLGKIFVLIAVILFIQKRPRGLFALKGRAVEV